MPDFATQKGWRIIGTVRKVGTGLNVDRAAMLQLLKNPADSQYDCGRTPQAPCALGSPAVGVRPAKSWSKFR